MTLQHVSSGRTVPLSALRLDAPIVGGGSWSNIREFTGLSGSDIEALGKRIKSNGITSALLVQQIRVDGEIENLVIDGQRRYLGAREVLPKNAEIPVQDLSEEIIEELTPEIADELTLKALTTIDREDLSSFELSTVAERMKARGKTLEYIGKAVRRDPSWVSKMLKARSTASPKLMTKWRKGDVTDEQFKELAEVADQDEQANAVDEVVETRKKGGKGEARVKAKEIKETARGKGKKPTMLPPAEREQADLFDKGGEKPAPRYVSRTVLEEFFAMADKRPPTADYVKGIFDGAKHVAGLMEVHEFSKAWHQYIRRLEGKPAKAPKVKKAKAKGAKAKKAKPAKAKKAPKKKSKK